MPSAAPSGPAGRAVFGATRSVPPEALRKPRSDQKTFLQRTPDAAPLSETKSLISQTAEFAGRRRR